MSEEDLTSRIQDLGAAIALAKKDKKPLEEWKPLLDDMLTLKVRTYFVHFLFLHVSDGNDICVSHQIRKWF